MAENIGALILPIGADVSQFEKSINDVKGAIKTLQGQISAKPFNLVTKQEIADLANLERTLESLQVTVKNVNFGNVANQSKAAGRALTSLSLIAQDAPFGFIGIQNNLPALIQTFGQLSESATKNSSVLKQLGSALVGPAGLFLAFSAVTAAVTVAVQKYGSLGAAIDALFGKTDSLASINNRAAKSLEGFNKEYKTVGEAIASANSSADSQILKLEALSETVLNTTASENARKKALEELKSLDNERFKNFDIEKGKLDGLTTSVQEYTNAVLSRAVADKLADRSAEALVNRELQRNLYGERLKQLDELKKRVPNIEKQVADFNKELLLARELQKGQVGAALPRANQNVKDFLELNAQIRGVEKNLINVNDQYEQARKIAKDATLEALAFGGSLKKIGDTKVKVPVLSIDAQDLDAAFNLDKIISNVTKLGNTILDTNKPLKERQEALKDLVAVNPQVFNGLTLEKNGLQSLKTTVEDYTRSLQVLLQQREFDARASQLNAQFLKIQEKATEDAAKVEDNRLSGLIELTYAQDKFGNSTDAITKKSLSFLDALKKVQDINKAIAEGLNKIYGPGTAEENDPIKRIEDLAKRIKQAKDNFQSTIARGLQQPFEGFFDTLLEEGRVTFDSFEGLVKNMLKRIAAQIISAGIAKLIASILFPQGAAAGALAGAAAGNAKPTGLIGALISLFGGRGRAMNNVNFGGVNSGGMQMAGSVNLQLRGSDLVASINRTNTTINRVG